jgi:hypothetical protein
MIDHDRQRMIEALHRMEEEDFLEGSDDEAETLLEEESVVGESGAARSAPRAPRRRKG